MQSTRVALSTILLHCVSYIANYYYPSSTSFFKSSIVQQLATKYGKTPEQIFFRFVQAQNILPLTGTSSVQHMMEDLDSPNIPLTVAELTAIDQLL